MQRRDDTITQLSSELEAAHSQSTSLRGEVEELGRLREELIDHVERLHAEKHKLEDRVAHAEQHAQVREGWRGEGRGRGGEERRGDRGVGEGRGGGREGGRGEKGQGCCVCCIVFVSMLCMCITLVHWSV